jgi:glutamate-1-semialdehyde 2,1-aminomutase
VKVKDREYLEQKLKVSGQLLERGKKCLLSHYTNGNFSEFVFFESGKGSKIVDKDGNEYIDYAMGLGPLLLGHAHPDVVKAATKATMEGSVHGFGNTYEVEFAKLLVDAVPGIEKVAFTNSGTEATLQAIKCARAITKRKKIGKFEGNYHGTHDYAQISGRNASSGDIEDPKSVADFGGIYKEVLDNVITLSMNVDETFDKIERFKDELACIILEPIPLMCPLEMKDFIKKLRDITKQYGILLIFDEVVTGFRLGFGGAIEYFGIVPDLVTYGKLIGGGFPVGAVAGPDEYMKVLSFNQMSYGKDKVYLTGTFNGNPVTCAAGVATLEYLKNNRNVYDEMEKKTMYLRTKLEEAAKELNFTFRTLGAASLFVSYFHEGKIENTRAARWKSTMQAFMILRRHMLKNGVILSDTGSYFLSTEHTYEDCDKTVQIFKKTLEEII